MKNKLTYCTTVLVAFLSLTACNGGGDASSAAFSAGPAGYSPSGEIQTPSPIQRSYSTDVLLFVGSGTWASEVSSLKNILAAHGASYQTVSSAQLEAMSVDDLAKFGVFVMPGGSGGTEAASVSADTHARLRQAVQERGLNYVGFCAGAFVAVAPAPASGRDVSYGFGVVAGPELNYYYLENQGQDIAMTLYSLPDGSTMDILYYGGPVTPNVPGGVVAKYPNGDPAISEMWSGNGLVIISGGHPTATQAILSSLGVSSSDGEHTEFAWKMIQAAMHQQPLPAF